MMISDFRIIGTFLYVIITVVVLVYLVRVLFLLNLYKTLQAVSIENRTWESGLVWLGLIPLFSMIWNFFIVINVADSLKAEFEKNDINVNEERPSYSMGLTYSILSVSSLIPFLGGLASLASLVFMIIYWVKTSEYKNILFNKSFL